MSLQRLYYKSVASLKNNSSTILTCIGAVGVIATTIVAVKDTPKAIKLLEDATDEKGEELTKLEVVKVAGPVYIPSAMIGLSTIACIFSANSLNKKRQAALTSAYALVDNAFKEYKIKAKEIYGEDADARIIGEIAKGRCEEIDITTNDETRLFFDYYSMRKFESTLQDVKNAEYEFNRNFVLKGYASLNEFYECLGLPGIEGGDELGWSVYAQYNYAYKWIDIDCETVSMEDGLECCVITMSFEPHVDYLQF